MQQFIQNHIQNLSTDSINILTNTAFTSVLVLYINCIWNFNSSMLWIFNITPRWNDEMQIDVIDIYMN